MQVVGLYRLKHTSSPRSAQANLVGDLEQKRLCQALGCSIFRNKAVANLNHTAAAAL